MIHGVDTGFLVAVSVREHPAHGAAQATLSDLVDRSDRLAMAPQVLAEFIHIVTDARRFSCPLEMDEAVSMAKQWWGAEEIDHIWPDDESSQLFLDWISQLHLGRKRLLDTLLAATYHQAGVRSVLTTNPGDFAVFGRFSVIVPGGKIPGD